VRRGTALFAEAPAPLTSGALVPFYRLPCAYGETGIGWPYIGQAHCHRCLWAIVALIRQFRRDVAAGLYDAEGYTPAERRAQQKRREAA
jgi:hypothetical protein